MQKSKLGFSLIELSIVILVIGILVIGITKGSRIILQSKIVSARSLTQNSPVVATNGLILWLDTTRDLGLENNASSFNVSDGDTIKNWYSINPQSKESIIANQATQGNQPVYVVNGINGLPSLVFDGTTSSRHLAITDSNTISPSSEITIFAVMRPSDLSTPSTQAVLSKDISAGIGNPPYALSISSGVVTFNAAQTPDGLQSTSSLSSSLELNNIYILRGYVLNQQAYLVVNANARPAGTARNLLFHSTGALRIGQQKNGSNRFFNGQISEIIMFNRALKNYEVNGINQYLSSKYGVKL